MAGYRPDHSMSNRAHEAYENNIRPYSRWSKKDILDALPADIVTEYGLQSYPTWFLKEALLQLESWHHTGKMYNRTNFWEVTPPNCSAGEFKQLYKAAAVAREKRLQEKNESPIRKVKVTYLEWASRNSRPTEITEYGVVKGSFVYLQSGGRKRLDGNYLEITQEYDRAPRGTGPVFEEIKGRVPR